MAVQFPSLECNQQKTHSATNQVRRPVKGMVLTSSGRRIPQPPWIITDVPHTQTDYDLWLVAQSRIEAAELGDDLVLSRVTQLDAHWLNPDTRHMLNDYLFGMPNPEFEARDGPEELPFE